MIRCPNCNCRDIGKIGTNQFYCWECFVEFNVIGDQVKLYQVQEDGSLCLFDDVHEPVADVRQIG